MSESIDLTIISFFAAASGNNEPTWRGNVNIELPDDLPRNERVAYINEQIFRMFNRVDDEDAVMLETVGYDLPSLSVGDMIIWGGKGYEVASIGFRDLIERPLRSLLES